MDPFAAYEASKERAARAAEESASWASANASAAASDARQAAATSVSHAEQIKRLQDRVDALEGIVAVLISRGAP